MAAWLYYRIVAPQAARKILFRIAILSDRLADFPDTARHGAIPETRCVSRSSLFDPKIRRCRQISRDPIDYKAGDCHALPIKALSDKIFRSF